MKVVYSRCAGLDVHKKSVQVCIRIRPPKSNKVITEFGQFCTFNEDLERLHEFLRKHKVKRVVMESTGVYWIPVWNILEQANAKYELVLVNPQHVKALPGRKTDHLDCKRLAELGQYDLLRASFIPPVEIRQLRDLTRRRASLQRDWNRLISRVNRLLEMGNVKLTCVMSKITTNTGLDILRAIVAGKSSPLQLAELAQGSLRDKREQIQRALPEHYSQHFRWLLRELWDEMAAVSEKLVRVEARIREQMQPYEDAVQRLCTIPAVQEITAWTLIAELGLDMSQFPSAAHCASWAGLCPGNNESAGKRLSGRTRKGNRYLRRALTQNAWAVAKIKDPCPLTDLFYRVAARQGMKKAAVAVAHRLLIIAYCILRDGTVYKGGGVCRKRYPAKARQLMRRLARMGFPVVPIARADAATPAECPRCARWQIPCIHANNRIRLERTTQTIQTTEA